MKKVENHPQMNLVRMFSLPDLADAGSMYFERSTTDWTDAALLAKNFCLFPIAGYLKVCYANHGL